jgi:hypothetical protein
MVLAAMYMLRLISAVLHQAPGSAVSEAALDLRPAELGVLVPLVALMLVLSAWPAAITDRSFPSASNAALQNAVAASKRLPPGASYVFDPTTGCISTVEHTGAGNGGVLSCSEALREALRHTNPSPLSVVLP